MAELLLRIGSAELAEWITELGVIRPQEEKAAMDKAKQGAK